MLHDILKATLHCSRHSSAYSGRYTSGLWKLRYLWIMRDFGYSLITEQNILVRDPLWRDAKNAEALLFTMFFAFVPYGSWSVT